MKQNLKNINFVPNRFSNDCCFKNIFSVELIRNLLNYLKQYGSYGLHKISVSGEVST